jgi:serine protease Do
MPDGKKYKGKSLGSHLKGDIGLVKITDKVELPFAKIAKANDHNKGDWCFALGYPGGFNKERGSVVRIGKFIEIKPNLIWTDCTLLGGDSGGPLFNFKGEIVGINSRIFATSEDNLHGPAELYLTHKSALEKGDIIRSNRRKPSPFLGVATTPAGKGLSVTEVVENSSADKAGIITGDIILKIGNKDLNDTESLIKILKKKKIGQNIDIKISREGKEIELSTVLGKRP